MLHRGKISGGFEVQSEIQLSLLNIRDAIHTTLRLDWQLCLLSHRSKWFYIWIKGQDKNNLAGHRTPFICINGEIIMDVEKFVYLGTILSGEGRAELDSTCAH